MKQIRNTDRRGKDAERLRSTDRRSTRLKWIICLLCVLAVSTLNAQHNVMQLGQKAEHKKTAIGIYRYFEENSDMDELVNARFDQLSDHQKVAQLIMPAMGRLGQATETIFRLVKEQKIGGILMLNGTKEEFTQWITQINAENEQLHALPFLYSADAEPSLVNRKITGTKTVKKASDITSEVQARIVGRSIAQDLSEIGINYNFAPVVDMVSNKTVGYRGFGEKPENIVPFAQAFIEEMHNKNIIATIKHFPGHGLVVGDTHKSLLYIDGELKEVPIFKELIDKNVTSVMVGHLAVKNNKKYNTNDLPATVAPNIISKLLREELGFKGIIITDAMGMGGVVNVKNSSVLAIDAGNDILLMPKDADKAHAELLQKYQNDPEFQKKVDESVKRVIRMKLCITNH